MYQHHQETCKKYISKILENTIWLTLWKNYGYPEFHWKDVKEWKIMNLTSSLTIQILQYITSSSIFYDVIIHFWENIAKKCWHKQKFIQFMLFWCQFHESALQYLFNEGSANPMAFLLKRYVIFNLTSIFPHFLSKMGSKRPAAPWKTVNFFKIYAGYGIGCILFPRLKRWCISPLWQFPCVSIGLTSLKPC